MGTVHDHPPLRGRTQVFRDRAHAGSVLAEMLADRGDALVCAIPAGGVPVGVSLARALGLPLEIAVVSKITLPWNTEAGFGAVSFDGAVRLNDALVARVGLGRRDIDEGIERTREKITLRNERLRGKRPWPKLRGRQVLLVDDGLASGFTMRVAIEALARLGADRLSVAVPTAHERAARALAAEVEDLYCANLRGGASFAVADAYERWYDVGDDELIALLEEVGYLTGG
jgi:predicted phosphoribosyltransferase